MESEMYSLFNADRSIVSLTNQLYGNARGISRKNLRLQAGNYDEGKPGGGKPPPGPGLTNR